MINWPCLLNLEGDDELLYLNSEVDFIEQCRELILCEGDSVIDSQGKVYRIELVAAKPIPIKTEQVLTAEELTVLVRAHEFKKAEFCLTKIHFLTVSAAVKSLMP